MCKGRGWEGVLVVGWSVIGGWLNEHTVLVGTRWEMAIGLNNDSADGD